MIGYILMLDHHRHRLILDRRSASLIIVFSIIAAVKANQGQPYTYPLSIKFVS